MAQIDIDKFNKITIAAKKDLEFKAPADGTFNIEVISVASGKKVDIFANDGTTKVKEFTDSTVAEEWLFEYKSSAWAATKLTASTPGKDEKTLPVVKKSKTITVDDTYPTINDPVGVNAFNGSGSWDAINLANAPNNKRQYTISASDASDSNAKDDGNVYIMGTKKQANDYIVLVLNGYGELESSVREEFFIWKDPGSSDVDLKYSKFGTDVLEPLYSFTSKDNSRWFIIKICVDLKGEYYPVISRFAETSKNKTNIVTGLSPSGEISFTAAAQKNLNLIIPRRSDKMPEQVTVNSDTNTSANIYKGYGSPDVIVTAVKGRLPVCTFTSKDDGKWFKIDPSKFPAKVTEYKNATPGTTKTITTEYTMSGKFTDIVYVDPSATMLSVEDGITYKIRGSRSSLVIDVDSNYTGKTFYIDLTESLVTQMVLEGITQDWESVNTFFRRDRIAVKVDVSNKKIELLDDKQYFEYYNYTKYPTINVAGAKVTSTTNIDMSSVTPRSAQDGLSSPGREWIIYDSNGDAGRRDSYNFRPSENPTIKGTRPQVSDIITIEAASSTSGDPVENGVVFYLKKEGTSAVDLKTRTSSSDNRVLLYSFTAADEDFWFKVTMDDSIANVEAKIEKLTKAAPAKQRLNSVKDISKDEGKSLFVSDPKDQTNFVFTGKKNSLYSVQINGEGKTGRFMYLYKALGTTPIRVGNVKVLTHKDSGKWWKVGADNTVVEYTGAVTAGQMDITKMPLIKHDSPYSSVFMTPVNAFVVRDGYTIVNENAGDYFLCIPSDFKGGNIYIKNLSSSNPDFTVANHDYGKVEFGRNGRGYIYISPYPGTIREILY